MLRLVSEGIDFELPDDFSIRLLLRSPLFVTDQIRVSNSFPFTLKSTKVNDRLLQYQGRVKPPALDISDLKSKIQGDVMWGDRVVFRGYIKVNDFKDNKYNCHFLDYTEAIFDFWSNTQMSDMVLSGSYYWLYSTLDKMLDVFEAIANSTNPESRNISYFVFPVYDDKITHPWLNQWRIDDETFVGRLAHDPTQYAVFPKLETVVRLLFKYSVMTHGSNNLTTSFYRVIDQFFSKYRDWKRACLFNAYILQQDGSLNWIVDLANCMPNLTALNFMMELQNYLGIRFIFDTRTRTVELVQIQDILNSKDIVDFNDNVASYFEKTIEPEYNGFILKQTPDGSDEYFEPNLNFELQKEIAGDKQLIVESNITFLINDYKDIGWSGGTFNVLLPICSIDTADNSSLMPRIMFYNGMENTGVVQKYPKGDNKYNDSAAYVYYNRLSTYAVLQEQYLKWILYHRQPYVFRKQMTIDEILNINWKQIYNIKDTNFLINQLDVTLKKNSILPVSISAFTV